MLLGKRARPSTRRTTSTAGFTGGDQSNLEAPRPLEPQRPIQDFEEVGPATPRENIIVVGSRARDHRSVATFSPRYHRNSRGDSVETTADFLRTCGLCKRRLSLARDIYMYRGDTAFCSQECREQQMNRDERKRSAPSPWWLQRTTNCFTIIALRPPRRLQRRARPSLLPKLRLHQK
ncbi:hypothetical protein RJ639_023602 [Escallonia herrerae]|uniref:FLZ-type domain-containing protein n=1 Tax=Escallonia herrerae TaxID=1293975 RepID=A0AA88UZ65_9ASTE|nr:hypothetical protein RJ639_023602 [Escallonia herrerae]